MATQHSTPRLQKFESERLLDFYNRSKVHFMRHGVSDPIHQAYDFMTGLPDSDFRRVSQALLPKTIESLSWDDLKPALVNIEGADRNRRRLEFANLKRNPGQSIREYADTLKALSLECGWETTEGGEAVRQLKFLTSFSESHILQALMNLDDDDKYDDMVKIACEKQAIFENSAFMSTCAAPITSNQDQPRKHNSKQRWRGGAQHQMSRQRYPRCPLCFKDHQPVNCPFKDRTCKKCHKQGHLEEVCRSQKTVAAVQDRLTGGGRPSVYNGEGVGSNLILNNVYSLMDKDCETSCLEVGYSQHISQLPVELPYLAHEESVLSISPSPFFIKVHSSHFLHPISFMVDTGASVTLIDKALLPSTFPFTSLFKYVGRVTTANGNRLEVLGVWGAHVTINKKRLMLSILITCNMYPPAIAGRDTLYRMDPDWKNKLEACFLPPNDLSCSIHLANPSASSLPAVPSGNMSAKIQTNDTTKNYKHSVSTPLGYRDRFPKAFGITDNDLPLKGYTAHINLNKNVVPVFQKSRPVPLALKPQVEAHLKDLEKNGIIYSVPNSEWASPLVLVKKKDGGLRCCVDFKRTVNPNIRTDVYPPPLPDELITDFSGCKWFCKIDLTNAYLQMEVHPTSRLLLTVNTHIGLFRYRRLVFGLSAAPAIFQSVMDRVLSGLPHCRAYLDDCLIGGKTKSECEANVLEVLNRLNDHNIKINENKSVWYQTSVSFLGLIVSEHGKSPDPSKVQSIAQMPYPKNPSELKSFLGLINFYRGFLGQLSSILEPLHALLRKGTPWQWTSHCSKVFDEVRQALVNATTLVIYDPTCELVLTTDSSAYGVGAVLSQRMNGVLRPVAFESATLNSAQRRYSQLHKEALAIIFGLQKFHRYLYGRHFTIECDHQPLRALLSPDKNLPAVAAARMVRWAEVLMAYNYSIVYRPGNLIPHADAMSRLPLPVDTHVPHVAFVHDSAPLVSLEEIQVASDADPLFLQLKSLLLTSWRSKPADLELRKYFPVRSYLEVENGVVYFGSRVVVPEAMRAKVLKVLHEGHLGLLRMREAARLAVWWPGMDKDLVTLTQSCLPCNRHAPRRPDATSRQERPDPEAPWERVHMDLFELEGHQFFIVIDAFSNWVHLEHMSSATAANVIKCLKSLMSTFGLFQSVVSDNGPPFNADHFKQYLSSRGIQFMPTPPYNPQSNGRAEAAVHRAKQGLRKAAIDFPNSSWSDRIFHFMATQHATPSSLGHSPMARILNYIPRTHLTHLNSPAQPLPKTTAGPDKFGVGVQVWVMPHPLVKHPVWEHGIVVGCPSHSIRVIRTNNGQEHRVHVHQVRSRVTTEDLNSAPLNTSMQSPYTISCDRRPQPRPLPSVDPPIPPDPNPNSQPPMDPLTLNPNCEPLLPADPQIPLPSAPDPSSSALPPSPGQARFSGRVVKKPKRFDDYIM